MNVPTSVLPSSAVLGSEDLVVLVRGEMSPARHAARIPLNFKLRLQPGCFVCMCQRQARGVTVGQIKSSHQKK